MSSQIYKSFYKRLYPSRAYSVDFIWFHVMINTIWMFQILHVYIFLQKYQIKKTKKLWQKKQQINEHVWKCLLVEDFPKSKVVDLKPKYLF